MDKCKDFLKLYIKLIMRFFLKIFWIFPLKEKRILFISNMGKSYSCNPKYIYESVKSDIRFKDYELVWGFASFNHDINDYKTKVIYMNKMLQYFYYLLSSGIIIYNCGGFSYAPIRKRQYLIETWHGGGTFKNVGLTVSNKTISSKKGIKLAMKDIKLFLSSSLVGENEFVRAGMGYQGFTLHSGMPRNDIFYNCTSEKRIEIKEKIGISKNEKIVLFAPTFRGSERNAKYANDNCEQIDVNVVKKALHEKFGGVWKFFIRGHQYASIGGIELSDGDLTKYPDMQELLLVADVLITDYSSSIWDFALTRKPCILYVPDLVEYEKKERGFVWPITEWPGIITYSNEDLYEKINAFDRTNYIMHVDNYLKKTGSFETGTACNQVKETLLALDKIDSFL